MPTLLEETLQVSDCPAEPPADLRVPLARLRREIADLGLKRRTTGRIVGELLLHVVFLFGGMLLFLAASPFWLRAIGVALTVLGSVGIGTNTHTSSHYATSSRRWVNQLLTYFGYPFSLGFSAMYWWSDHVSGHHVNPNVQGLDNDFDYLPFFAITEPDIQSATGMKRRYYEKWQWLVFFVALPLFGFNLQRCGLIYLFEAWREGKVRKPRIVLDAVALALHAAVFLVLPAIFFGPVKTLELCVLRFTLTSLGMYVLLAPAHFPAETPVYTQAAAADLDHCHLQTTTTINFNGSPFLRWIASGLDYQIEHHLFPEISHVNYPRISPVVEEFCRKHGLPYRTFSFHSAVWESLRVFRKPKAVGQG